MSPRHWLIHVLIASLIAACIVALVNAYVDPYGLREARGRYIDILVDDSPEVLKMRFDAADYNMALLGSSRLLRMDPVWLDSALDRKAVNLSVAGASLGLNEFLLRELKHKGKNFLCGFDCFTLNRMRDSYKVEQQKQRRFREVFRQSPAFSYTVTNLFNIFTLRRSINTLQRRYAGEDGRQLLADWNRETAVLYPEQIEQSFRAESRNKFSAYSSYPRADIQRVAELADSADIFLIPPVYEAWYDKFDSSGVREQYFESIRHLVHHTRGQVWSFYGRDSISRNLQNFDANGWHFKPRLAKSICASIFGLKDSPAYRPGYGTLLTPANVDACLDSLRAQAR